VALFGEGFMKAIQLVVEDEFYPQLMALIEQLPKEIVQIIQSDSASDKQQNALDIHEHLMEQYASAFERLAK
jgi:hypothetical protein